MKKEIVDLIIKELLKHKEEIIRLEIDDRVTYLGLLIQHISGVPAVYLPVTYLGLLIQHISGVPAVYLPVQIAEEILSRVGKEIRLSRSEGLFKHI